MNKRIYLIILYIVTIFICIGSVAYYTGRAVSGCAGCVYDRDWVDVRWDGGNFRDWNNADELSGITVEEDYQEKGYKDIEFKGAIADVIIAEGDGYSFHFKGDEVLKPNVSVKNDTLVVTQKKVRTEFNNRNRYAEITITVPAGSLKKIEIESAVGDVTLKDLSCEKIKAVMAVGSINTDNVNCSGDVRMEANVGGIFLKNSSFGDMDLNSDVGEIEISGCTFEDADIDSDIAGVTIKGINPDDYDFDIDCSLGDFEYNGKSYGRKGRINNKNSRYTLRVSTDIGGVEIVTK